MVEQSTEQTFNMVHIFIQSVLYAVIQPKR